MVVLSSEKGDGRRERREGSGVTECEEDEEDNDRRDNTNGRDETSATDEGRAVVSKTKGRWRRRQQTRQGPNNILSTNKTTVTMVRRLWSECHVPLPRRGDPQDGDSGSESPKQRLP